MLLGLFTAGLVVVQLFVTKPGRGPNHLRAQRVIRRMLRGITARHGLDFADTETLFAGRDDCYLPHDGNFNEQGHRLLASFLSSELLTEH